jgi:hypothetical protein
MKRSLVQGFEITVSDRQDGRKLAFLRYFIDLKNRRVCWTNRGPRALSVQGFVFRDVPGQ